MENSDLMRSFAFYVAQFLVNLYVKITAMKSLIGTIILLAFSSLLSAQTIVGKWQLVKQTNCLEGNMTANSDSTQMLIDEMKSMGSASPQVVTFKEKMVGEESTRILTKRRAANNKTFLYRFDGESLMILDKKSQTLTDSFQVEKFSSDSLIVSSSSRPCDTKIFLRIR
jgi:hypothetical protein